MDMPDILPEKPSLRTMDEHAKWAAKTSHRQTSENPAAATKIGSDGQEGLISGYSRCAQRLRACDVALDGRAK